MVLIMVLWCGGCWFVGVVLVRTDGFYGLDSPDGPDGPDGPNGPDGLDGPDEALSGGGNILDFFVSALLAYTRWRKYIKFIYFRPPSPFNFELS